MERLEGSMEALMYPHKGKFMDTISEYIDFSGNEELWREATEMTGLGQSILNEGIRRGMEKGVEQGIEQGIQALILDNIEEQIPKERTIEKLQKRFKLTEETSVQYYERFTSEK